MVQQCNDYYDDDNDYDDDDAIGSWGTPTLH